MSDPHEDHVTKLLQEARSGDASATEQLFALIYEELRTVAQHQRRRWEGAETLNTTALVHEAFLKLLGTRQIDWQSRAHLLAVSATAMRQILIDYARSQQAKKRGGGRRRITLEDLDAALEGAGLPDDGAEMLLALDEALERLARNSERLGRIVECRFFAGMSIRETAEVMGVSVGTVNRGWAMAQAWLYRDLREALEA